MEVKEEMKFKKGEEEGTAPVTPKNRAKRRSSCKLPCTADASNVVAHAGHIRDDAIQEGNKAQVPDVLDLLMNISSSRGDHSSH